MNWRTVPRASLEQRFWAKVRRSDGCWEWQGSNAGGYGRVLSAGGRSSGKWLLAHRVSWELLNGPIGEGLCVCHRCDNPLCVRPGHLFLGTRDDNNKDRAAKGRSHCWRQRLTPPEVELARLAYETLPINKSDVGRMLGITPQYAGRLLRGCER